MEALCCEASLPGRLQVKHNIPTSRLLKALAGRELHVEPGQEASHKTPLGGANKKSTSVGLTSAAARPRPPSVCPHKSGKSGKWEQTGPPAATAETAAAPAAAAVFSISTWENRIFFLNEKKKQQQIIIDCFRQNKLNHLQPASWD